MFGNIGIMFSINWKRKLFLLSFISIYLLLPLYAIEEFSDVNGTLTNPHGKVFVMYAGSLVKIFEDIIGPAFQNQTGYQYVGEGKGSLQITNLIKDGFRTPDIFVSGGTIPITRLMNNSPPLAEWLLEFGSAEIVISFSPHSPYKSDLEKARKGEIPWYTVLSEKGFKFGRTDPELDPKGYYTIIAAKLANIYYNDSSIKDRVLGEDRNPKQIFPEETLKSVLELGQLDAVASYKHEAIARGLSYIMLPKEISLSDPAYYNFYKIAQYTSESNKKVIYGEPIYFSITIPKTVKNMDGATSFVNFLLSKNGLKLLENQGLIQLITKPIKIPFLANGRDTCKKTCQLLLPRTCAMFSKDLSTISNAAMLARIKNGDATYVWDIIIPNSDWVNSTLGKTCWRFDWGLNAPRRSAPLAKGGITKGMITIIFMRKLPGNLYRDRQYARGIPNRPISIVEIEAVTMLRIKASTTWGLVIEASNPSRST